MKSTWGAPLPTPPPRQPTAGPWLSHDTDEGEWVVDIPNDGQITVSRLFFGDMETNTGRDISNADLVASAPLLLEVCQRAEEECRNELVRIEMSHGGEIATRLWTELGDVLRAAIKRATVAVDGDRDTPSPAALFAVAACVWLGVSALASLSGAGR